ncbi:hypothetical protein HK099_001474, partial [Clydaea vesicula]
IYKDGDIAATSDRSVNCSTASGEVSLITTGSDTGVWTVDLVNLDTGTTPVTQNIEISFKPTVDFDLICDTDVTGGNLIKCQCKVPTSKKGSYLRIHQNGEIDATRRRNVNCPLNGGAVQLNTTESDSGHWTIDLVNRDSGTIPKTKYVQIIPKASILSTPSSSNNLPQPTSQPENMASNNGVQVGTALVTCVIVISMLALLKTSVGFYKVNRKVSTPSESDNLNYNENDNNSIAYNNNLNNATNDMDLSYSSNNLSATISHPSMRLNNENHDINNIYTFSHQEMHSIPVPAYETVIPVNPDFDFSNKNPNNTTLPRY